MIYYLKKYWRYIFFVCCILLVLSTFLLDNKNKINAKAKDKQTSIKKEVTNESIIQKSLFVDIKGAVVTPGVYEMEENKRIIDQTTPNMIQRISGVFERKPLILKEI